tara:strand:+ start:1455 stop:2180 length:726 start_codon:yes stop_codon:yes gene_type:complete
MTTLVLGASGATGRKLVEQLLLKSQKIKIIVRAPDRLPEAWLRNKNVIIIQASVSELSVNEMAEHLLDCQAVASCLGHHPDLKGIYGKPRKLVTEAIELVCRAIRKNAASPPTRVVLMNTAGNRNRDLNESYSLGERLVTTLLRWLVPPHPDNEQAAEYLRQKIGQQDPQIAWVVVRPDSLIDEDEVTSYEVYRSPIRSPLFNAGKTSRINVGNFMARLVTDADLWNEWQGQMPVLYNTEP